jgi:hypothetical protein
MRTWTTVLAATLAGLALTGVAAGTAAAASVSADNAVIKIAGPSGSLKGLQSAGLGSFQCPADHPYMWNHDLAPGRSVPFGTEVHEAGSVGVTMDQFRDVMGPDGNSYLAGHTDVLSSATNWDLSQHDYQIFYYCTNDLSQAAPDSGGIL